VGYARALAVFFNGDALPDRDIHGKVIRDDSFYLMFNGGSEPIEMVLPASRWAPAWRPVLDTAGDGPRLEGRRPAAPADYLPGGAVHLLDHHTVLLATCPVENA
jgi:hypothetical protein